MDARCMMARVQQPGPFPLVSANPDAPICDGIGLSSAEICHETGLIASHVWTGAGLIPPTSAQGPDRPASALICTRAGRIPPTPATGLGPPRPHLHWDRTPRRMVLVAAGGASDGRALHAGASAAARTFPAGTLPDAEICDGTGLAPAHSCRATGLTPPTSALGHSSPLPTAASALQQQRKQDWVHPVPHSYGDMARPWSMFNDDWAHPSHILSGTESARPSHICTGTGRAPAHGRMLSCADCAADG